MTDLTNVVFLQTACLRGYKERASVTIKVASQRFREHGIFDMLEDKFSVLTCFSLDTILDGIEFRVSNGVKYSLEDPLLDLASSYESEPYYIAHTIEMVLSKLQLHFPSVPRNVLLAEFAESRVFANLIDGRTRMWTEGAKTLFQLYLEERGSST